MRAVGQNLCQCGPGDQAALRTKLARAHSLIIRIEQEVEVLVEDLVAKQIWAKDEGLEKLARMGQVPFGRAYVRH